MIDRNLYCETFSRLRASKKAKREVLQMKKNSSKRLPRVLRSAAIAAAMCMALAVTAGAVNIATDGELFRQFTVIWSGEDSLVVLSDQGEQVEISVVPEGQVTVEEGRMILHVQGEEIDITDEIADLGSYHYAYDMTVIHDDGSEEVRNIALEVRGSLEQWTLTQDNGDGTFFTMSSEDASEQAAAAAAEPSAAASIPAGETQAD